MVGSLFKRGAAAAAAASTSPKAITRITADQVVETVIGPLANLLRQAQKMSALRGTPYNQDASKILGDTMKGVKFQLQPSNTKPLDSAEEDISSPNFSIK